MRAPRWPSAGPAGRTTEAGYVTPTVFAGVSNAMRIAREVVFGPVLAVIPYEDEDDAVHIANDSDYGLAGTVWTADAERGLDIARRVRRTSAGIRMGVTCGDPLFATKRNRIHEPEVK
jgi:aldehyde dehydrogenase (NAD+)